MKFSIVATFCPTLVTHHTICTKFLEFMCISRLPLPIYCVNLSLGIRELEGNFLSGAFSPKFSISHIGKTADQIQRSLGGAKNGRDFLFHHSTFGGDLATHGRERRETLIFLSFFFVFHPFYIGKFVLTETLSSHEYTKIVLVPMYGDVL